MNGIYFTREECDLLIPLLIRKLDLLEGFSSIGSESEKMIKVRDLYQYREILGKIFAYLNIG